MFVQCSARSILSLVLSLGAPHRAPVRIFPHQIYLCAHPSLFSIVSVNACKVLNSRRADRTGHESSVHYKQQASLAALAYSLYYANSLLCPLLLPLKLFSLPVITEADCAHIRSKQSRWLQWWWWWWTRYSYGHTGLTFSRTWCASCTEMINTERGRGVRERQDCAGRSIRCELSVGGDLDDEHARQT